MADIEDPTLFPLMAGLLSMAGVASEQVSQCFLWALEGAHAEAFDRRGAPLVSRDLLKGMQRVRESRVKRAWYVAEWNFLQEIMYLCEPYLPAEVEVRLSPQVQRIILGALRTSSPRHRVDSLDLLVSFLAEVGPLKGAAEILSIARDIPDEP